MYCALKLILHRMRHFWCPWQPWLWSWKTQFYCLLRKLTTPGRVNRESRSVVSDSLWPMDCTVHGTLQARILEWVAVRGSSQLRDRTQVSCTAGDFFFNWRLITLQYCSGFCHILTWLSHGCTCVPHPEPLSYLLPHPIPQGHPSAPALSTLSHPLNLDWRSILHMIIYMFQCYLKEANMYFVWYRRCSGLFWKLLSLHCKLVG